MNGGAKRYTDTTEHEKGSMPRKACVAARETFSRKKVILGANTQRATVKPSKARHVVG